MFLCGKCLAKEEEKQKDHDFIPTPKEKQNCKEQRSETLKAMFIIDYT